MRITALYHTEMAEQLFVLQVAVSSATEFVLGRSPSEPVHVYVSDELVTEF
jgi:hypothetical protein